MEQKCCDKNNTLLLICYLGLVYSFHCITLILPSSAKPSKASASVSAEISLILDSTHPPPWNLSQTLVRQPQWKKTSIEDDLNGRRPHMEDDLNGRRP